MRGSLTARTVLLLAVFFVLTVGGTLLALHGFYFCAFFILLVLFVITYFICNTQKRYIRMMRRMIEGIRHSDLAFSFPVTHRKGVERELTEGLSESLAHIRRRLAEKEERFQLYESLLGALDSDLLTVTDEGAVEWMNSVAIRDLTGERIRHIDELKCLSPEFPHLLRTILPGQVKTITLEKRELNRVLIVTVTGYLSKGRELRLISLRNIYSLLDQQEFESWQKLIRVLTHEIMNSITPIISLSETLHDRMAASPTEDPVRTQALQTIYRRSKGLLEFVKSYRQLTRLSMPQRTPLDIRELFSGLRHLYPDGHTRYFYKTEEPLPLLMADRDQLEQLFINLIKNATEASQEVAGPVVRVSASFDSRTRLLSISVQDNGVGIPSEVKDRIFVPFFTTKPGGSGIGLSLCKQIMTLHEGTITVHSEENKGSTFTLHFIVPSQIRKKE